MEEARLNHLLRGLPREAAPLGFTAQVLRRLDEKARPAENRPHRLPPRQRWHRLMVATATVGALGVSVGVSVGVLQRERPSLQALQPPQPLQATAQASAADGIAATAGGSAALPIERTFRHEAAAPGELPALGLGPRQAASRLGDGATATPASRETRELDSAQAHQLLRQLQIERDSLERELRRLRRPGGGSPTVFYLGGDDKVDLVLSTGRARVPGPPPGDRDDGENFNYL